MDCQHTVNSKENWQPTKFWSSCSYPSTRPNWSILWSNSTQVKGFPSRNEASKIREKLCKWDFWSNSTHHRDNTFSAKQCMGHYQHLSTVTCELCWEKTGTILIVGPTAEEAIKPTVKKIKLFPDPARKN